MTSFVRLSVPVVTMLLVAAFASHAQSTAFTYQGRLTENGAPVNASLDKVIGECFKYSE